jgi:hypothetical protein
MEVMPPKLTKEGWQAYAESVKEYGRAADNPTMRSSEIGESSES